MALQSFNLISKFQYMLNTFNFNPISFYSVTAQASAYGTPALITQESSPNPNPKEMFQV